MRRKYYFHRKHKYGHKSSVNFHPLVDTMFSCTDLSVKNSFNRRLPFFQIQSLDYFSHKAGDEKK
jgi:hypothetical protein